LVAALGQLILFHYGLGAIAAIGSLSRAERWEAYALVPIPPAIIFLFWNSQWVLAWAGPDRPGHRSTEIRALRFG